jgi:hypothetical protein
MMTLYLQVNHLSVVHQFTNLLGFRQVQVKCILPFTGFEPLIQICEDDVQRKLFPEILQTGKVKYQAIQLCKKLD